MDGDERLEIPPGPRDGYPASGGALRDLPAHRRLPVGTASEALTEHYRRTHPEQLGQPPLMTHSAEDSRTIKRGKSPRADPGRL